MVGRRAAATLRHGAAGTTFPSPTGAEENDAARDGRVRRTAAELEPPTKDPSPSASLSS